MRSFWQRLKLLRQPFTVGLLACVLLGVQLVQASPLHQHTQHSVDCVLCHLQLNECLAAAQPPHLQSVPAAAPAVAVAVAILPDHSPSPYHSRAPPTSPR